MEAYPYSGIGYCGVEAILSALHLESSLLLKALTKHGREAAASLGK